jgi:hypothetical protein
LLEVVTLGTEEEVEQNHNRLQLLVAQSHEALRSPEIVLPPDGAARSLSAGSDADVREAAARKDARSEGIAFDGAFQLRIVVTVDLPPDFTDSQLALLAAYARILTVADQEAFRKSARLTGVHMECYCHTLFGTTDRYAVTKKGAAIAGEAVEGFDFTGDLLALRKRRQIFSPLRFRAEMPPLPENLSDHEHDPNGNISRAIRACWEKARRQDAHPAHLARWFDEYEYLTQGPLSDNAWEAYFCLRAYALLDAIMVHPNTPSSRLAAGARRFTKALNDNPVLPLLPLERPDFWDTAWIPRPHFPFWRTPVVREALPNIAAIFDTVMGDNDVTGPTFPRRPAWRRPEWPHC